MTPPILNGDWIHLGCGGTVKSHLAYSDADTDFYIPVCEKCQQAIELKDASPLWWEESLTEVPTNVQEQLFAQ